MATKRTRGWLSEDVSRRMYVCTEVGGEGSSFTISDGHADTVELYVSHSGYNLRGVRGQEAAKEDLAIAKRLHGMLGAWIKEVEPVLEAAIVKAGEEED